MKFVSKIIDEKGITAYKLSRLMNVPVNLVQQWAGQIKGRNPQKGMAFRHLAKLRKLSGLSWNQFGALLDKEFLDKEDKD